MEIRVRGTPISFEWGEDKSAAAVEWAVDDIRIIPTGNGDRFRLVIEGERAAWFWVWGNTDAGLVQETMEAQFEGKPSRLLEEVRDAFARFMRERE